MRDLECAKKDTPWSRAFSLPVEGGFMISSQSTLIGPKRESLSLGLKVAFLREVGAGV